MQSIQTQSDKFYFIGIGGIGMSAIARYLLHLGYQVGGYDRTETPITQSLVAAGASVTYLDDRSAIAEPYCTTDTLVIYTPAIPNDNQILIYYKEIGAKMLKRSEALGYITARSKALCVAGTHGKTTTSTLLAHLLQQSSVGTNAFLGGISLNYQSNLVLHDSSDYVVVEADEYDRSFHRLSPYCAIITSTQPDHLDIYSTPEAFNEAFDHFASLVHQEGIILLHEEATLHHVSKLAAPVFSYGASAHNPYHFDHITYRDGELYFDWHHPSGTYRDMHLGTPIEINVHNATAALAIAHYCGATESELRAGLASFRGAHRRFERVLNDSQHPILIDDYAHHPDEIAASLSSIKKLYPGRHLTVVFQPHLYSRTADFAREFGEALSKCDDVILLDIYPARELPIPGITSHTIAGYITNAPHCVISKAELVHALAQRNHLDIVVMMGAGDIEFEVAKVRDYLLTISAPSL